MVERHEAIIHVSDSQRLQPSGHLGVPFRVVLNGCEVCQALRQPAGAAAAPPLQSIALARERSVEEIDRGRRQEWTIRIDQPVCDFPQLIREGAGMAEPIAEIHASSAAVCESSVWLPVCGL